MRQCVAANTGRASARPVVLAVSHNRGGGTLRHVHELAQHLQARAHCGRVELALLGQGEAFRLEFRLPEAFEDLLHVLRATGVTHLHFHHLIGHDPHIMTLPARLGLSYDFTAHDFYTLCSHISFFDYQDRSCAEQGLTQCTKCLQESPAPGGLDIRSWPDLQPERALPRPRPRPLSPQAALKVVVLGALARSKGADLLEEVAMLAARSRAAVEFHLLGYAYRNLRTQPRAHLSVLGSYEEQDLPRLLARLQPDVVWFPALCPETYSYTLSACLSAGLPVVAPDLGVFPERLSARSWSWIQPWQTTPADWLEFFLRIRDENFMRGHAPTPTNHVMSTDGLQAAQPWTYEDDYLKGLDDAPPDRPTPGLGPNSQAPNRRYAGIARRFVQRQERGAGRDRAPARRSAA